MFGFWIRLARFLYWKVQDIRDYYKYGRKFSLYGLRLLTGRQGSGKTIGLVYMLETYRRVYPKCKIVTNFGYIHETEPFTSWKQLTDPDYLNGEDGLIVGWDEIQNDFSSTDFKNIPDSFLHLVTQQRKQKICILGTSQVFTRTLKALREQCFQVGECRTFMGRWTRCKFYDASDYSAYAESGSDPKKRKMLIRVSKISFIQTNTIRKLYDSYAVIKQMVSKEYVHPMFRENSQNT